MGNSTSLRKEKLPSAHLTFLSAIALIILAVRSSVREGACAEAVLNPKDKVLELIQQAEAAYEKVTDYTALFTRQERVNNFLLPAETYHLKFRKPLQIYLKCVDANTPRSGLEMLYCQGQFKGKILMHLPRLPEGVLPTAMLDPLDPRAMENSRYPMTDYEIGRFLNRFSDDFRHADLAGEVKAFYNGTRRFDGLCLEEAECLFIPLARSDYTCYRCIIYFDRQTRLPLRVLYYDWGGALLGNYAFSDVRLNVGLADADFDPRNKAYDFGLLFVPAPRQAKPPPLGAVLTGCDRFARVVFLEPERFLIFDTNRERDYYIGYNGDASEPVAIVTQVDLPHWPEKKAILFGLRREGGVFRTTTVQALTSLRPNERQFLEQFSGKSPQEVLESGKHLKLNMEDAHLSAQWTAAIRESVERLLAVVSDKAALELARQSPKEKIPARVDQP